MPEAADRPLSTQLRSEDPLNLRSAGLPLAANLAAPLTVPLHAPLAAPGVRVASVPSALAAVTGVPVTGAPAGRVSEEEIPISPLSSASARRDPFPVPADRV